MTAWFVLFLAQAMLVAVRRTDVHRKLGFVGAGLGVAVLVTSLMVTAQLVPRLAETRGIDGAVAGAPSIVWANAAALLCFAVFLSSAIALRRRAEVHKRLMLLAAISVVQPAIARISRWTMFDSIENALFSLMVLSVLILPLLVHDFVSRRRIHPVTIVGGGLFLGMRAVAIYGIAASDFGRSVVRSLT